MQALRSVAVVVLVMLSVSPCLAKDTTSSGILAASVGNEVVLVEPNSGTIIPIETGPVGWLYPAPGGILFAPDVINNQTTVISLMSLAVVDRLEGLTMPHFAANPDRYTAITDEIVVLSYPDRAIIKTISATITHPWQVIMAPDGAAMIILERLPDGSSGVHMSTVNLITGQVVYRRPLSGDIRHMALSPQLGIIALADAKADVIHLGEPATLTPVAAHATDGDPVDLAFTHGGKILATAIDTGDGTGILELALFKAGKKKGLRLEKEFPIPLTSSPVRVAVSPGESQVAVALEGGDVVIIDVDEREIIATATLPDTARDLRWCDPTREGPMIPDWSDGEAPTEFGEFVPKVRDGESSGLEEPVWKKPPS